MLDTPLDLPAEKFRTLHSAVEALKNLQNVVGVVLGGSYACGFARPDSDIDIGVYYRERSPFSVDEVRFAAQKICTAGSVPVVTGTYEWGPWVNGGAWIQTPSGKVDFLYKNLDQVHTVIEEAQRGIWRHDYDQQPPYGFRSIVFLGETSICVPLYDPEGAIGELKKSVAEYPEPLRNRIVQETLWGGGVHAVVLPYLLVFGRCLQCCGLYDSCGAVAGPSPLFAFGQISSFPVSRILRYAKHRGMAVAGHFLAGCRENGKSAEKIAEKLI